MRVLLATDGSEDARRATGWLAGFPLPPATAVRVVMAVVLPHSPLEIDTIRSFNAALLAAARQTAGEARAALSGRWPDAEIAVREGDPRQEIPRAAEEWGADLVVLGARGLGAVRGFLLGSVSTGVVRHARCPVLVVKGPAGGLARAVVAVDGSADSLAAARFFASLPLPRALRVRLLAVVEPLHFPSPAPDVVAPPMATALDDMVRERKTELEGVLARVERDFRGKVAEVEASVSLGRPSEEIAQAAREPGVDLVVVGARGLGVLKRLVLGSVSERVLHHVECPVLIVKGARAEE